MESMLADFATHRILAARIGSEIVDSVRARATAAACHIGRLIVHPHLQRQGLGSKLMHRIEEKFADARRHELFTGHLSEGISPSVQFVYMEKYGI